MSATVTAGNYFLLNKSINNSSYVNLILNKFNSSFIPTQFETYLLGLAVKLSLHPGIQK